ncbi:MAG: twin-arginine translocase subunit TatB [Pseudorhodobacter sp.]|nr:twin-arginine translocase subunit TatB [Pseudorhodobacter sp.]
MFNFGWAELMVIGVVALIVIGPEDLPDMFRQLGRFTAKLRAMSREFSRAMDQAAKESGVKDVAKDLKGITSPKAMGLDAVKGAVDKFEKWDPIKNAAKPAAPLTNSAVKPLVPPPMPATPPAESPMATTAIPASAMPTPTDADALDDLVEADDDLADHAETIHGPATQALYDKQAARAAVMAEQSAKLKAIDEGTYMPAPAFLPLDAQPKKAPKSKALKAVALDAAPDADTKPRKSSKKADQA